METTSKIAPEFLSKLDEISAEDVATESRKIMGLFKSLITHGEQKTKLATQTYDMVSVNNQVERHIRRLDSDLNKFEEEQMTGPKLVSSKAENKYIEKPVQVVPRPTRGKNQTTSRKQDQVANLQIPQRKEKQRNLIGNHQPLLPLLAPNQRKLQRKSIHLELQSNSIDY